MKYIIVVDVRPLNIVVHVPKILPLNIVSPSQKLHVMKQMTRFEAAKERLADNLQ